MRTELTSDGKWVSIKGFMSAPDSDAVEQFKQGSLHWKVPATHPVALQYLPDSISKLLVSPVPTWTAEKPRGIHEDLWDNLFPYQKETVSAVVHKYRGRCLLAHEMGLGKTVQAIALMQHYGSPVLVLCPAFLKLNWKREISKWAPSVDATIVSYDSMRTNPPGSMNGSMNAWKLVVADESHYIKHLNSQRTQAALPYIMQCDHALLLSGTPCPNRPEELFAPLCALRPSIVGSFQCFAKRYCNARKTRFCNFDTTGHCRQGELSWLLRRAFMLRKTKDEVKLQLPPKNQIEVHVESSDKTALCRIAELSEQMEDASPLAVKVLIGESFRATCRAKLDVVSRYCVAQATRVPTVVFAHHCIMLDRLQSAAEDNNLNCVRIDGSTSHRHRQQIVDAVQRKEFDIACFSMAATGVGLTLTAVSEVIFAELPWNPAVLRQCEDRVYRIGQESPCFIRYIMCNDTLDDYVWKKIYKKERVSRAIV